MLTSVSVNLKKEIDKTLQLKDSIIQEGKVYRTDKTTMKIPENHPSLWQASPRLVFIPSLQLFIASCMAARAHFACIRQSIWAERSGTTMQGVSAGWIDRGDTLSSPCPISCSWGTEVRVGRDHRVAAFWQILYASSQLRWCLFKCEGTTGACWQCSHPCTGVGWGGDRTHKKKKQPTRSF